MASAGTHMLYGPAMGTTTNKPALDKLVGETEVIEIIGKPYDLQQVVEAVRSALRPAQITE